MLNPHKWKLIYQQKNKQVKKVGHKQNKNKMLLFLLMILNNKYLIAKSAIKDNANVSNNTIHSKKIIWLA
jgi:hypothetical protein